MGMEVHNRLAQFAFTKVSAIGSKKRDFRTLARSMPSIIQVNGLGAAVAFLCAKKQKGNAHEIMYKLLSEWFQDEACLLPGPEGDFMKHIVYLDSDTYRLYTNESMNVCLWVKRFAEGLIGSGEE